ncbi:unnamed protein product [Rotaria sordida]|uniref:LIM zinc-binding domain-containing protein n=1 Tax=Rotaria sordida TaxID=392033 RepID=A0A818T1Y8_9BILA|nr:unnamed protein product [Rotaria sordida]
METLMERLVSTNTKCYACGALVYAVEKKKTANHIYHNRCFRCRICKRNLTESSLNEEGDDIYCANCYRKKQSGDCNSLDFRRAASERAQYIYNNHDSDQTQSSGNPRPPIRHDFSRHPSLTLRQIERQFLSYQPPNFNTYKIIDRNSQTPSLTFERPIIKTSFSTPIKFITIRRSSSLEKDQRSPSRKTERSPSVKAERSPSLHFSPVFSPIIKSSTNLKETTFKTSREFNETKINNEQSKPLINSITNNRSQLKNILINSTKVPSHSIEPSKSLERKHSIVIDVNQNNNNKQNIFRFPSTTSTVIPIRHRNNKLLVVYRGQLLSHDDMIRLQSLVGQHITMSQYISTTKDIRIVEMFAGNGERRPHFESVVYEIDTSIIYENYNDKPDPSIYYYDISHISHFSEEEVLFRIGTIFKVVSIEEPSESIDNRWHVKLRLEKGGDFRSKNTINRTPMEIVQSFFNKASQKKKISVENIINERLSSNIIIIMSVFIRLGHLVKHHPQEQLHYYQSALSKISSNESSLLEVGYEAIRMRCTSSVNDWTSVPLSIYRQTVLHIDGDLRKQLYRELARINEARGDFHSAKMHYNDALKYTNDCLERQLILSDLERLNSKVDDLKPVLPSNQVAYWYLYATVLTSEEQSLIDHKCDIFHRQCDDDDDADPDHLLDMPNPFTDEYIQNCGSHASIFQLFDSMLRPHQQRNIEENNSNQQPVINDIQYHQQIRDDENATNQLRQQINNISLVTDESSFTSDCIIS